MTSKKINHHVIEDAEAFCEELDVMTGALESAVLHARDENWPSVQRRLRSMIANLQWLEEIARANTEAVESLLGDDCWNEIA